MRKNNTASASAASYVDIMEKNHMEIPWHDYADADSHVIISQAGLIEKSSVIGRVGLIMLSCGTGAWRVRTSMNRLSRELGVTCTVDVGLMSISFNCFDGKDCVSQSLSIANTGVNTSKLYRMEQFVDSFPTMEAKLTGEEIHKRLDEIEEIHGLYSPVKLGFAAALACSAFTFLLGGGPVEMILAFIAAGIGNFIRVTSLDEFPQFFNVLKGDMSIVGTRPPLPNEWEAYELHHRARLAIKPGITGMWQVSGRSEITDFEEVVKLDTKYINEWSLGLDIKILFKTVMVVLKKEGSM